MIGRAIPNPSRARASGHVGLAELPAQPDLAPDEGGEVDEAALDVAEGDAEGVDAGDGGRHLVDDALHPQRIRRASSGSRSSRAGPAAGRGECAARSGRAGG